MRSYTSCSSSSCRLRDSSCVNRTSSRFLIRSSTSTMSNGFVRKSRAPWDSARCFASVVTSALTTITGNQRPWNQG